MNRPSLWEALRGVVRRVAKSPDFFLPIERSGAVPDQQRPTAKRPLMTAAPDRDPASGVITESE